MRFLTVCLIGMVCGLFKRCESLDVGTPKRLVDTARRTRAKEDALYQLRYQNGVDKKAEDFKTIEGSIFEETPELAVEMSRQSRLINWISFLIRKEKINATVREIIDFTDLPKRLDTVYCPFEFSQKCTRSKYRSVDGSCNNLEQPLRGASFTPFAREMQPEYESSVGSLSLDDQPRRHGKTGPLPGARIVSRVVHQRTSKEKSDRDISAIFTFWGQFMAHMISDRAVAIGHQNAKVDCCSQGLPTPRSECFNIEIPEGDPFRADGRTCLGFLRSMEATTIGCVTGKREQLNLASSYIDGSAVYGSDKEKVEFLRTHNGGELSTSEPNQLPFKPHPNMLAQKMGLAFARAGDPRAPEVPMLTGIHTVWLREHNRIARELAVINRLWDDERLYQEARRIIVAMIQHITYNEWLPILFGPSITKIYDLRPRAFGFYTGYDPTIDASTTNVVSTAAFRFGHSLVTSTFPLCEKGFTEGSSPALKLGDIFFRSNQYLLHEHGLMRGLLKKPVAGMDAFIVNDLTNKLFKTHHGNGGDLAAFNIQRGRDHGLPSYNSWRKFMGQSPATSFTSEEGGFKDIPEGTVQALALVYSHTDDVDVWTGGVSEKPVSGGLLGPLFSHLLARQFSRYRQGDRFWYETSEKPQAFTAAQLEEIRMVSFARVLCNSFELDTIQPQAFRVATADGNGRISCSHLRQMDLSVWQE